MNTLASTIWALTGLIFFIWRISKQPTLSLLDLVTAAVCMIIGPCCWILYLMGKVDDEPRCHNPLHRKPKK